jgi:transposase
VARTHGRALRGQRLRAAIPHGHWKTAAFIAGLRNSDMIAPMVLNGPVNGVAFQAYVDHVLVARRRRHHEQSRQPQGRGVKTAIAAAGARLLYFPPYSPGFNPIENAFSKLKAMLRKAAERSVESLWNTIGRIIDTFTATKCANYFAAAGYDAA